MTRRIETLGDLTENEKLVLRALSGYGGDPVTCMDLARHTPAHIRNGRGEWAMPILKRLARFGLVEKTPLRLGNRSTWRATAVGLDLLQRDAVVSAENASMNP